MGIVKNYLSNIRRPSGWMGNIMVTGMNRIHVRISDWGIAHLIALQPAQIAELGCGGGRNTALLLKRYPEAHLSALDYSDISVKKTAALNRREIDAGRCRVVQGDVSDMPFEDESFDLITAFETVYFWPGPVRSFREVARILKPNGLFMLTNDIDGENPYGQKWKELVDGLHIYDKTQLSRFLHDAGFADVRIDHDKKLHRLCVLARKKSFIL